MTASLSHAHGPGKGGISWWTKALPGPDVPARAASPSAAAVWLVGGLVLAAFLVNLYVVPNRFIVASLYVVPVVIAAQRLRADVVAMVSAFSVILYTMDALVERPPGLMIPLEILALVVIAFFAVSLARQSEQTRAALEERARLYTEAQEAIRARDDFLSVAGHELRTPVNAVKLLTGGLLRKAQSAGGADGLAGGLERLSGSVDRLSRLTDQVLDVSQIAAGKLVLNREEFDLAELVREVAARFQDGLLAAGSEVEMRLDPAPGVWDRARLDQVVTNLLANALKYGGGKPIRLATASRNGAALLAVRDHGIGIAPEERARIFERFERAASARPYRGLGIGLWIVRRIVDAHRGSIEVKSEPGKGAEFRVTLPLA